MEAAFEGENQLLPHFGQGAEQGEPVAWNCDQVSVMRDVLPLEARCVPSVKRPRV